MLVIVKRGRFIQDVFSGVMNLEEARGTAVELAQNEPDCHHTYEVREVTPTGLREEVFFQTRRGTNTCPCFYCVYDRTEAQRAQSNG